MLQNKSYKEIVQKVDSYFNTPIKKILGCILASSIIWLPLTILHHKMVKKVSKYAKYTIGITGSPFLTLKSGFLMEYDFSLNGKNYYGSAQYNQDKTIAPGGRYFVRYDSLDPSLSYLLDEFPVPDSITNAPLNGWGKIPGH
jgi:alpha-beta hydrolase superfamily lysophospholipase